MFGSVYIQSFRNTKPKKGDQAALSAGLHFASMQHSFTR
jgi:hypothetical protein